MGLTTLTNPAHSDGEANTNAPSKEVLVATPAAHGLEELVERVIAKHLEGIKDNIKQRPRGSKAPVKHTKEGFPTAPRILWKSGVSAMPLGVSIGTVPQGVLDDWLQGYQDSPPSCAQKLLVFPSL